MPMPVQNNKLIIEAAQGAGDTAATAAAFVIVLQSILSRLLNFALS